MQLLLPCMQHHGRKHCIPSGVAATLEHVATGKETSELLASPAQGQSAWKVADECHEQYLALGEQDDLQESANEERPPQGDL